ncbi:MAG: dihydrodipicolinate synthase family protein [Thaumarchaeota archaeon]|nr:dihydrodipicolinate synthase family protein [Nitrososphaerota archaeon]
MAKQAEDVGADAVMVMPPYGVSARSRLAPPSAQDIVEFYGDLSGAVDIPVLVYNSDTLSTHLPVNVLSEIFEVDGVVGMEETSLDFEVVCRTAVALGEKGSVLVRSQILLPALQVGAHGGIMPVGLSRIGADLYDAYQRG